MPIPAAIGSPHRVSTRGMSEGKQRRTGGGSLERSGRRVRAVRVGCSGWNYQDWRERFYPRGTPPSRWLAYYASVFDTVEVNSTFYRLASRDAVERWVRETPDGVVVALKASRYLTHIKRLTDLGPG